MKIFLTDQNLKFPQHLELLKRAPVMIYNKTRLKEKTSQIFIKTQKRLPEIDLESFFNYCIFPDHILSFQTQWAMEKRKMKIGDTILQQVYLPPIKAFSQKIIFGVRVSEIINSSDKLGFSYEALKGHVEKGISIFTVEQEKEGISFRITTFSKPGNLLAIVFGPIFAIPYQTYCTNAALKYMKNRIEEQILDE
jgi:uncharacterized protein (UPF0548 family)